ncbi:MAG TPA: Fic family protein [Clostridium sp.]|nr:Fic family protein [Clostridium sp.]
MKKPYVPFMLPNDNLIDLNKLINKVVKANTDIAIYNEKLKSSKIRPELLLDLLSLREAIESTKIEGTQVTMDEMLEYRAEEKKATSDITEVMNYYRALEIGENLLKGLPISTRLIKKIHGVLMSGNVRGKGQIIPGEFRTSQNFIGPKGATIETASYIPPEPQLVDAYISNLEKFINDDDTTDNLIKIALVHSQFETIHPFSDGNGRTGRILIPLYLFEKGLISKANFFVSESLEKDKFKYYQLLNNTRVEISDKEDDEAKYYKDMEKAKESFTEWLDFFLTACINQAAKNIDKIDKINDLYDDTMEKTKSLVRSSNIQDVIDILFLYPIFTTKLIREKLPIAPATLNGYLRKLVDARIIYTDGKPRNKKYFFYDLINIIR